jgi:hypothetical protein
MSLCYREQRQLRGIEAGLFRSDSRLVGMLETFGRLYRGQDMPASERVLSGQGRDRRAVTRIVVAFAVAALALSILFIAALTTPARSGAPASGHRPPSLSTGPGREADDQQNPAGRDRQSPRWRPLALNAVSDASHTPPGGIGARRGAGHPAADHRGIHPDRSMTAHPAGAETRSRVLQSGGDHDQDGHSRNIRRVRRCEVSKPAARAGIRSPSATRSVSVAAWARRCAPRSRSSRPARTATRPC